MALSFRLANKQRKNGILATHSFFEIKIPENACRLPFADTL
jgi:hypothetical protein